MKWTRWTSAVVLLAFLVLPAALARAEANYTGLDKAMTNFFTVLDKLVVDVPKAATAEAGTRVLDAWTAANDKVADAGQTVVRLNPGFQSNPPLRFTEYFKRCTVLPSKYAPVTSKIGDLIKQYRQDSEFAAALGRYQRSLQRLAVLLQLGVVDKD